jgi:hypothetical protein
MMIAPSGAEGLAGLLQNLGAEYQQKRLMSDLDMLLQSMGYQGPAIQTPQIGQLMLQSMLQNKTSPLDESQILLNLARAQTAGQPTPLLPEQSENLAAQTEELRARTGQIGKPPAESPATTMLKEIQIEKIKQDIENATGTQASDVAVLDTDSGLVSYNKKTGEKIDLGLQGKQDPKKIILNAYLKANPNPETWTPAQIKGYTQRAAELAINNLQPISDTGMDKLTAKGQMINRMDETRIAFANADKRLTGVLLGRYNKVKEALGAADPELATFVQTLSNSAVYLRSLAGANFTKAEMEIYEPLIPGIEDNPEAFIAKLDNFRRILYDSLDMSAKLYNQQGYNVDVGAMLGATSAIPQPTQSQPLSSDNDNGDWVNMTGMTTGKYNIDQLVPKGGKLYRIVGFDKDGEPLVDPVK